MIQILSKTEFLFWEFQGLKEWKMKDIQGPAGIMDDKKMANSKM